MRFMMRRIRVVALLLVLSATPVRAEEDVITLENQTYTLLHYRVRTPTGPFTEWRVVLPGAITQYENQDRLIIQIQNEEELYDLDGNTTYAYYRPRPGASPQFVTCDGPSPKKPVPPGPPHGDDSSAEAAFAPLSQFLARCKELKAPCRLSLKQLAAECREAQKTGGRLPPELRHVHGFTWFVGYMVDDASGDVILLGIKDPSRPPVDLDCLVTAIQCAYSESVPRCSLESHPNPALQKCLIEGVPWKTRWADVMIRADYDMKKLSQGQEKPAIAGFKSWLQHFAEIVYEEGIPGDGLPSEDNGDGTQFVNRWWFNFNSRVPRAVADSSGKIVYLYRNPVRLSTEQEVKGAFGTGDTTVSASRFADEFTKNMEILGKHYPNIAELQAIYRVYDLMRHLHQVSRTAPPNLSYWLKDYQPPYGGPPPALPTLTITRPISVLLADERETTTWKVRGGVSMRVGITRESLRRVSRPANWRLEP